MQRLKKIFSGSLHRNVKSLTPTRWYIYQIDGIILSMNRGNIILIKYINYDQRGICLFFNHQISQDLLFKVWLFYTFYIRVVRKNASASRFYVIFVSKVNFTVRAKEWFEAWFLLLKLKLRYVQNNSSIVHRSSWRCGAIKISQNKNKGNSQIKMHRKSNHPLPK